MSTFAPDPIDEPIEDVTEQTPLLPSKKPTTPLPKRQLLIICLIRIVEPLCFQVVFPFINQMASMPLRACLVVA